ncbi:hypothetical protein D1872_199480 [compost metagenome]
MGNENDIRVQLLDEQIEPVQFILSYLAERNLNLFEACTILDKAKELANKHTKLDSSYTLNKCNHPQAVRMSDLAPGYQP